MGVPNHFDFLKMTFQGDLETGALKKSGNTIQKGSERGHHSQMKHVQRWPRCSECVTGTTSLICLDFWVHLDDKARTEGYL